MFQQATKFAPRSRESFQLASDAGYTATEFWLSPKLIDRWWDVVETAKSFSFDYALHFPNQGELTNEQLEHTLALYRALNCNVMVIHQPMFDVYGPSLLELDSSVRLAVENHHLTSDKQLDKWANASDWLTLDVEHLWVYTHPDGSLKSLMRTVEYLLSNYGERIAHVHLPGYLPGQKEHRPQYCSRNMVMKCFSMFADYGYSGMVVSEIANRFQNPEDLLMDRLLLRRWQAKRTEGKQQDDLQAVGEGA